MAAMGPQIAALAPLLIVVRIGLGQAIEENISHLSRSRMTGISNSHPIDSDNGNLYGPGFRATTTRNEGLVGDVIIIGHIKNSDHNLCDTSNLNRDGY
ncbi:hypothetical protein V5O48_016231 [Marasmius crinis-equi]|uniref:Uncharacterized protein n=1 Tax=Marasmius crinis-equi TaxID=585013 RepID=A0ABR3ES95_9AGAR